MLKSEVTVDLIEKYLDQFGWKLHQDIPEKDEKEGVVMTGWHSPTGEGHPLIMDPMVEKGSLTFRAAQVLKAPPDETPAERLNGLLLTMLALNYKYILGGFAYDPRDGEVVFKLGIPVDSDDLEYEDFEHCLRVVIGAVEGDAPKLKAILEGTKTAQELVQAEGLGTA